MYMCIYIYITIAVIKHWAAAPCVANYEYNNSTLYFFFA